MSLLVAWIGHDTHAHTSAYIASESRATWSDGDKYDGCRKVFYSRGFPEIIGYCGDVLFPSLLLNTIIDAVDNGLLFNEDDPAVVRYEKFKRRLFSEFHKYPKTTVDSFEIVYINKEITQRNYPSFFCHTIKWQKSRGFSSRDIGMPEYSCVLHKMGSGAAEFEANYAKFQHRKNKGTTRNVFHCFTYTLRRITDPACGGPPQLVGLYRRPGAVGISFGLVYYGNRYYDGVSVTAPESSNRIEWRNVDFELCDGVTGKIKPRAKHQPKRLGP